MIEVKRRFRDPFILVGGDFNQWLVEEALEEFPDIREANVGFTREEKCIDRMFTNFGRAQRSSGTVPPLDVEQGQPGCPSDHRVAYVRAALPRIRSFEWMSYSYRYFNEDSSKMFGDWLAGFDWAEQVALTGSNNKANYYQKVVTEAMEKFFPLIHVRRKTTDLPWVSNNLRKMMRDRNDIYMREGKSDKWRLSLIHI